MGSTRCSECGTTENIRPAREYPDLSALLKDWGSLDAAGGELLCPQCAELVCAEMRASSVRICRLDPSRPAQTGPHTPDPFHP